MNRRDRRAAEAASRKEPERRLPLAPQVPQTPRLPGAVQAFHARRVAAAAVLGHAGGPSPVLEVTRETLAFGDALIEREAGVEPPACAKGCRFCCYVDVAASLPEALLVADHLARTLDEDALRALRARLAETDDATRGSAPAKGLDLRVPCAFLGEGGACSIYEVRPLACRGWSSLEVSACERGFANGDATSSVPLDQGRRTAASAVVFAVCTGAADVGLDGRPLRLVAAVRAALDDPAWLERWLRREPLPDDLVHRPSARAWAQNTYPPLVRSIAIASEP